MRQKIQITESKLYSIIAEAVKNVLNEKAASEAQQRFFGMVRACQKGELKDASPAVKKAADNMSVKDVKDFASTKHKGLPERVKEGIDENRLRQIVSETIDELSPKFAQAASDKAYSQGRYGQSHTFRKYADDAVVQELNHSEIISAGVRHIKYKNGGSVCVINNNGNYWVTSMRGSSGGGNLLDVSEMPRELKIEDKTLARKLASWWSQYGETNPQYINLADWHTFCQL